MSTATISSSAARAFRLTPSRKSRRRSSRAPRALASSTSASPTSKGGSASPAGDAVPRFPPIVPRLRICGEPTVRDASASAGRSSASGACIASVYVKPAPSRSVPFSRDQPFSSGTSARLRMVSGRVRSKLSSTSRSVPPAIGRASGRSAFSRSASSSVRGVRTSTRTKIRYARMTSLLANAHVVTMDDAGNEHESGWILIDDGFVREVGTGVEPAADEREDLRGAVVTPGLVNTHHHLYQTLTRARAQQADLFTWLKTLYPIWARLDAESEYAAARTGLAELALTGCTTVFDHHYVFPRDQAGM